VPNSLYQASNLQINSSSHISKSTPLILSLPRQ